MKKFLIVLVTFIILSNCEIKPQQTFAQIQKSNTLCLKTDSWGSSCDISITTTEIDGIEYKIFHNTYGVTVINHTNELLEKQVLIQQLQK